MLKLPDNIQYRVFDLSFKEGSHRYVPKDDKITLEEAEKNRKALIKATGVDELAILYQVHGNEIYYAKSGTIAGGEPKMDASYTDRPGVLLAIQTADCVPVLFFSSDGSMIAGAHCGWKGARSDILEKLQGKFTALAKDVNAIIGPSIHQKSYEVDGNYYQSFIEDDKKNASFFIHSAKSGHFMFDLPGYVRSRLENLGIESIYQIEEDTYSTLLNEGGYKYPSYRRACHTGEFYPRNLLTTIMIKND